MLQWWAILLIVLAVIVTPFLVMILIGVIYRGTCRDAGYSRMDGKTVIITGASAGLGKISAMALAKMGARLILACRNLKKAQPVVDEIIKQSGNQNVVLKQLDVSDFESVRKFAAEINEEEPKIDVLLNNAGIILEGGPKKCPQGFDLVTSTNHYGPFLLTCLLAGKLKESAPSRIVSLSSSAHLMASIDTDDLNYENRSYSDMKTYGQSKLCNILFTRELSKKLEGTGVTANCLHPGVVATELFDKDKGCYGTIINFFVKIMAKNMVQGAQCSIYLCHSADVEGKTGDYYINCRKASTTSKARDMDLARKLWEVSARDVKLTEGEAASLS